MKRIFLLLGLAHALSANAQTLSGRVYDENTGAPLPGSAIYIPDLKTGAVTDSTGVYFLRNLPRSRFVVQVKLLGYFPVTQTVDLAQMAEVNFPLRISAIEASEIVVTGSAFTSVTSGTSLPVVHLDPDELTNSGNLVNALAAAPGLSAIQTGEAVSKPVIRGLSYSRVVTVQDGARQEGQQWGDEHGLEIDEFSVGRIEVFKGPASLLYGSDALGGVIHILEPLPLPPGNILGKWQSRYSTNNGLAANSLLFEGNQGGAVWRLQGTYKNASPYRTPVETVINSAFRQSMVGAMAGLNRKWGYSHLLFSTWNSRIGFTEGERDSTGNLLNASGLLPTPEELESRTIEMPFQEIGHTKVSTVNNLVLGQGQLRFNAGWQQNDRKEFESPDPGIWMQLQTLTGDARYYFAGNDSLKGIESVVGFGGMSQQNENNGNEFLIPDYSLADAGAFVSARKTWTRATLNAGLRYDYRALRTESFTEGNEEIFVALQTHFSAFTGSAGIAWQPDSVWNLKFNVGRGFRAPNIAELSANGLHEGTFRYEVGNRNLDPETSLQADLGIAAEGSHASISLDAFYNKIDNYIYPVHTPGDSLPADGQLYPAFRYTQGNSTLHGLEASIDIHPVSNLHFENSLSWVHGRNMSLSSPLPFMPPVKMKNEVRFTFPASKKSRWSEPYLRLAVVTHFTQNRIDAFETVTPGASILQAGAGIGIRWGRQVLTCFIEADNLGDKAWFNHLSRLKDVGIHAMGRNFTFGLNLPIGIHSQ